MGLIATIEEVRHSHLDSLSKGRVIRMLQLLMKHSADMTSQELATARNNAGLSRRQACTLLGISLETLDVIESRTGHLALCLGLAKRMDEVYGLAMDGGDRPAVAHTDVTPPTAQRPTHVALELRLPVEQAEALERLLQRVSPMVDCRMWALPEEDYETLPPAIAALINRLRERAEPFE